MKKRIITFFVVMVIGMFVFSIFTIDAVKATDGDDGSLYFQTTEGDSHTYNFNYTGTEDNDDTYTRNDIALRVNVQSVTSDKHENEIKILVSAVGACKSKSGTVYDERGQPHDTYYSTKDVELSAKIDEGAHKSTELNVHQTENSISKDMNDGDHGGDNTAMHLRNTTYFAAETTIGMIPYIGTGYDIAKFAYEEFGPGGSEKLNPYASGPGGEAGQTFERLGDYAAGPDSEDLYGVGTEFRYTIDNDHLPDQFDMIISAKNIMGYYYDGSKIDTDNGAEASVEIPIKNGEPQLDENQIKVGNELEKDEPVEVVDEVEKDGEDKYELYPHISIDSTFLDNPAGCLDAEYDLKIKHDGQEKATFEGTYIYNNHYLPLSIYIDADRDPNNDPGVELNYTVTAHDEYGGWEKWVTKTFEWEYHPELTINTDGVAGMNTI